MNQSHSQVIFRLTALWALCESGLGGWMHALHLPFTGFFVGAFAIVLVSLIAFYSRNNFSTVVRATLLVILVKAAVSPQSPPPAYLAVAFQGFVGAALFRILSFPIACVLLGVLAMVESALQKVIIATLVFGKSLWQAIDALFAGIVNEFSLPANLSFSMWLIVLYTAIYAVWGLVLGIWMVRLPEELRQKASAVNQAIGPLQKAAGDDTRRRSGGKLVVTVVVLTVIVVVLLWAGQGMGRATFVVLRTFAIIALLLGVVNPLFRWLMQRWVHKQQDERQFTSLIRYLPEVRSFVRPAYQFASGKGSVWSRFKWFVIALLVLTIYPVHEPN